MAGVEGEGDIAAGVFFPFRDEGHFRDVDVLPEQFQFPFPDLGFGELDPTSAESLGYIFDYDLHFHGVPFSGVKRVKPPFPGGKERRLLFPAGGVTGKSGGCSRRRPWGGRERW